MSDTLKQRMRERRARMKETFNQTTDSDGPSKQPEDTWAAAMDDTTSEKKNEITTILDEEEDEEKQSEELLSTLATRRKRAKKELTQKLEDKQEDEKNKASLRERMRQQMKEKLAHREEKPHSPETDAVSPLPLRTETPDEGAMTSRPSSRQDTLGLPGEERPLSSRSPRRPSISMKQRLAEKLKAAKEKARDEEQDDVGGGGRKLAGIRGMPRTTRFDDPSMMKAEDFKVEEELDRVLTARGRREKTKSPKEKGPVMPTAEEQFDFFTRIWEPEPEERAAAPEVPVASTSDEAPHSEEVGETTDGVEEAKEPQEEAEEDEGKKKKKKKDVPEDEEPLLDVVVADDWRYYSIGRAEYKPFREKQEADDDILFVPPIMPAPVEEKIFEQEVPRYLEDEGLYVGRKPPVPARHLNRMENRLLKNKDLNKDWFGEDGRLIALPDPLKEVPSRPPIPEEDDNPLLATDFYKAVVTQFDSRFIDGSLDAYGRYQLDVDINTLTFTHHHLFSREHVLAYRLSQLCQKHAFRSKRKAAHFMSEKLKAVKAAAVHVQDTVNRLKEENPDSSARWADQQHRLNEYSNEILETRQQRDIEMRADRTLMRNIIHTWKQLKELRQFQQFTNTPVKLQIRKEATNKALDEEELAQDIEEELQEMRERYEDDYNQKLNDYKQRIERWKQQRLEKKHARQRQKEKKKKMKEKRSKNSRRRTTDEENESQEELDETHDETENEQEDKDREILEMERFEKPEKPRPFDGNAARQTILEKYDEIRRKPGEPILHPELSNGAAVTQTHLCPRGEQTRRNELNRYKCFVKVLFNNKEVSRTQSKPIGQEFVVRFADIFNVQIVQWPENIKLQVYETAGFTNTLLSELYIGIPDSQVTSDSMELDTIQFSCGLTVNHSHEGVGSGMPFSFEADKSNMIICNTTGSLVAGVAWGVDDEGNVLVPAMTRQTGHQLGAMKGLDAVAAIGASGIADPEQLLKWISKSRLDPNDPANADLMTLLRPSVGEAGDMGSLQMKEHFRLEQLQQEFDFVTDDAIENSRRFKIIQMREEEVPEFRNFKMVPANEKEIPDEVFDKTESEAEYEKKKRDEDRVRHMDEMESHRVAVAKFMQKVREQVMKRFRIAQHQKSLQDVVFEDALPNISYMIHVFAPSYAFPEPQSTIVPNLMKLVEPRHPLRPQRRQRKKMTAANLQQTEVKVLVNIVRAFDIPVRAEASQGAEASGADPGGMGGTLGGTMGDTMMGTMGGTLGGTQGSMRDPFSTRASGRGSMRNRGQGSLKIKNIAGEVLVHPFVEVMFQRNTIATSVADGPNPSWNEELKVPFKAPNNDYSSVNLQTVKDLLYINLFDEYVIDMAQDDRDRGSSVHRRIEKRWLGTIKIPFSTVYFNSRIDGTFRIDKPPVLLGYTHDPNSTKEGDLSIGAGDVDSTYITMFITIEPALQPAEPAKEKKREIMFKFESNEDEKLLTQSETWQADLQSKFPGREFKTTVVDINGKSVFMTRYFKPLKPPEELINNQESPNAVQDLVARFVSLVPFVSDSVVFPGLCDIWSTCDQFLQMLQGDEEEHAVLLINYFLHLGKKAWLILGSAVPEGPTAYVLSLEEGNRRNDYRIWNPSTGESYSYRDNYCPLQSVGCVANADNIWANIQPVDQPSRISFDLSNTSKWKPFFHKGFPHPGLTTVQPENLIYFAPDKAFVLDLQDKIERLLKERMMEWRPRHITRWNRYCMQAFRSLLQKLEFQRGRGVQQEHANELQHVLGSYKMSGFPINLPYTEMAPLIEAVYATGVHNNETNDVEFALAVHVHPYPNSVLSVWIYVASLVRKR